MSDRVARLRSLVGEGRSDAPGRLVDVLGRLGLAGYGVVHLLVAWLALEVAFGVPDAPADAEGAIGTIARTPGGLLALGLAAVGLFAFALWQVSAAAVGFRWVHGGDRIRKRVGAVAKAIAMSALAILIADYLLDLGSTGGTTAQSVAAGVLALPAGRVLLALGAGTILVIAGAMTYTGMRRTFMGDLDVRHLGPAARQAIELVGSAGHLARALALGVIGFLAGTAALFADPARAGGLDAALRTLSGTALGSSLLVVVAAGFAAFGLFCLADAATRRA
ncbi:DUF1206 domain-containing protein [Pseudonocardia sp.]|jgi:hypothetical protein|uniref:DUF1206 domain-containing protein n=1 Tax=Pseudonocardia sp. TaxID=60912 RepID=UPI0031FD1487